MLEHDNVPGAGPGDPVEVEDVPVVRLDAVLFDGVARVSDDVSDEVRVARLLGLHACP